MVVGEIEVGEACFGEPGGEHAGGEKGIAARALGAFSVRSLSSPLRVRLGLGHAVSRGLKSDVDSCLAALVRDARVAEHSLEIPHDEIARQRGARGVEKPPSTVRRNAVREREGTEVDVADERQTHRRAQPRGRRSHRGAPAAGVAAGGAAGVTVVSAAGSGCFGGDFPPQAPSAPRASAHQRRAVIAEPTWRFRGPHPADGRCRALCRPRRAARSRARRPSSR